MSEIRCVVCEASSAQVFMAIADRTYFRCAACEATFLDPAALPDRALEHAQYRLHQNDIANPGYRRFLSRLTTPLLECLAPAQAGLDYGCGPGPALAAMLSEAGHHMTVYDPLFFNDVAALEKRYDFITCSEVAEHFHDPAAEFARLERMLAAGGWMAFMTAFQTDDSAFANWHYRRDPTHVVFYREATFKAIARRHRLQCRIPCPNVALLHKPA